MIGWFNFIEGKMSSKWENAQEQYYQIQKSRNRKGSYWASTVVSCLNDIIRAQWFHQNEVLHDTNLQKESTKRKEKINEEVNDVFRTGSENIRDCDKDIFEVKEEYIKEWPIAQQMQWLKSVNIARGNSKTIKW